MQHTDCKEASACAELQRFLTEEYNPGPKAFARLAKETKSPSEILRRLKRVHKKVLEKVLAQLDEDDVVWH